MGFLARECALDQLIEPRRLFPGAGIASQVCDKEDFMLLADDFRSGRYILDWVQRQPRCRLYERSLSYCQ
jgi:hypothetical protein